MVFSPAFEEYLGRIERKVYLDDAKSYAQFAAIVQSFSGERWKGSFKQVMALKDGTERRGFDTTLPAYIWKRDYARFYVRGFGSPFHRGTTVPAKRKGWKRETVKVKGKAQVRYRDLKTGRFVRKPK